MVRVYGKENRRKTVDGIYCEQYALHAAVQDGNLMLVKSLCEQDGNFYPLDDSNKNARTGTVNWRKLKTRRSDGTIINVKDKVAGYSALHYAARDGHIKIAQYLAQKENIWINARTRFGNTAVDLAMNNHHYRLARMLQNNGGRNGSRK